MKKESCPHCGEDGSVTTFKDASEARLSSQHPVQVRQVNNFIKKTRGVDPGLVKGDGYFYFTSIVPAQSSVYVGRVSDMSYESWLKEYDGLKREALEDFGLDTDRLSQIKRRVLGRNDEGAMKSACGEYNCPCHYDIPFLLEQLKLKDNEIEELRNDLTAQTILHHSN